MKLQSRTNIAVAVAMALGCGVAQAATLSTATPDVFSQQGQSLSGSTAQQVLQTLTVVLGADYSVNDNITLRIAGATVGSNTNAALANPLSIQCEAAGALAPDGIFGNDPLIVSFITRNGNDILLRATQKNVLNTTGDVCFITGVFVTAPSLTVLTSVNATWNATTAITNIPFDPGNTAGLASVIDQFGTTPVQALNGIVDVNDPSLRRSFTTDDSAFLGTDDQLIVNTIDRAGTITSGPVAVLGSVVATVIGDISYVDNDTDGCEGTDLSAGAGQIGALETGAGAGLASVPTNCSSVVWTYTPGVGDGTVTHTFSFGNDAAAVGARQLTAPQSFTATARYNYSLGLATGNETDGPVAAGAWTLNGFSAFVPYMPYNDDGGISQIIYITNKSTQTGAVRIDAYNQAGVACNNQSIGNIGPERVTVLSGAIKTALEGCYGAGFNDRVSFTVTANVPAGRAELVTAYNVNGNRVQVANTSNGRVVQGGNSTTGGQL